MQKSTLELDWTNTRRHRAPVAFALGVVALVCGACEPPAPTKPTLSSKKDRIALAIPASNETKQNLKIVKVDAEKNVVLIAGSVPGARNSIVMVKPSMKKAAQAANKQAHA